MKCQFPAVRSDRGPDSASSSRHQVGRCIECVKDSVGGCKHTWAMKSILVTSFRELGFSVTPLVQASFFPQFRLITRLPFPLTVSSHGKLALSGE